MEIGAWRSQCGLLSHYVGAIRTGDFKIFWPFTVMSLIKMANNDLTKEENLNNYF